MSFFTSTAAYTAATSNTRNGIALVTGGKSGIGLAIVKKIATFPFIDTVIAVSRNITAKDVEDLVVDGYATKIYPLSADVTTEIGRQRIVKLVDQLCNNHCKPPKQLRFLVHSAGTIEPIKSVLKVQPDELRHAMNVNVEGPFFLTTALYSKMQPALGDTTGVAGRVLHVSSGSAHGAPPVGWGCYGITKAAFYQSFKVLEREFRDDGSKVIVGSFKPGVVDTNMQGRIRTSDVSDMPIVKNFQTMKDNVASLASASHSGGYLPRPPPNGALDSPDNVAYFVEYLLLGTTDEEFANASDSNEYDIRNKDLFPRWIPEKNLP